MTQQRSLGLAATSSKPPPPHPQAPLGAPPLLSPSPRSATPKQLKGLSLIEMMVALVLGALLTIGLIDVLVSSKVSYTNQENLARMQETGRFCIQTIARHLRQNRSLGCGSLALEEFNTTLKVHACDLLDGSGCDGSPRLATSRPIAWDGETITTAANNISTNLPTDAANRTTADRLRGDILVTWGAFGEGALLTNDNEGAVLTQINQTLSLDRDIDTLDEGRYAVITDCKQSEVFEITKASTADNDGTVTTTLEHTTGDNVNARASFEYKFNWRPATSADQTGSDDDGTSTSQGESSTSGPTHPARVYPLDYSVFYICCVNSSGKKVAPDSCAKDDSYDGGYRGALCHWSAANGGAQQLALNVEDMNIQVTTDGQTFASAADGTDWASVSGIKVELVLVSEDPIMDGERLRQTFMVNVAMRSLAPWYLSAWGTQ